MEKVKIPKSSQDYSNILKSLYGYHMGKETKRFLQPGGYKEYKKIFEKIIEEYDKETKGELMASEVKKKFLDEKKLEENLFLEAEKAGGEIEARKQKTEEIYQKMQELLIEMKIYFKQMENEVDENTRGNLKNCFEKKMKCLKEGKLDEANKIDYEIENIQQTMEYKVDRELNKIKQTVENNVKEIKLIYKIIGLQKEGILDKLEDAAEKAEKGKEIVEKVLDVVDTVKESSAFAEITSTAAEVINGSSNVVEVASTAADVVDGGSAVLEVASTAAEVIEEGSTLVDIASTVVDVVTSFI